MEWNPSVLNDLRICVCVNLQCKRLYSGPADCHIPAHILPLHWWAVDPCHAVAPSTCFFISPPLQSLCHLRSTRPELAARQALVHPHNSRGAFPRPPHMPASPLWAVFGWWYSWECIPELLHHVKLSLCCPAVTAKLCCQKRKQTRLIFFSCCLQDRNFKVSGKKET